MSLAEVTYDFPMHEKLVTVLPRRKRRTAIPHVFIVDANKSADPYRALKEVDVSEGTEFEVEKVSDGVLLKPVTSTVGKFEIPKGVLPPAPSYEERMRIFQTMQGDATDDSGDIDLEFIKASRTSKELTISFDD